MSEQHGNKADGVSALLILSWVVLLTMVTSVRAQLQGGGDLDPDLPPPVASEVRDGIAAEQLLFQAADKAYPDQFNISFTYSLVTTPQNIYYRIGWHGTPTAQGSAVAFGDLVVVHAYETPNYALLQQSWSGAASEMRGMKAGYVAFRFEGAKGTIFGVASTCAGLARAGSVFGDLYRLDIVSTTVTQAEAVTSARALAVEAETQSAAELVQVVPANMLSQVFNEANTPDPVPVPTPQPGMRLLEIMGPIALFPQQEGIDPSCEFEASHTPIFRLDSPSTLPFITKPSNNDFKAQVVIVLGGKPCKTGSPSWSHRLKILSGSRGKGRFFFDAKIDDSGSAADECAPPPYGPDTKAYEHHVLWSVQYHEANPLSLSIRGFGWDLTGIPTDILYDHTLYCSASAVCPKCNRD